MKPKTPFLQKITLITFGILCCFIILEISLRIGGLVFTSLQQYRNHLSMKQKGAYRILCLGESTTAGEYPPFLEEILNQRNIGIKFSVIDKGIIGTNTPAILNRLESNLDAYRPDMVITMMGINDECLHMPYEAVSDSKAIIFFKSFRIYKLTRLLWLHIVTRPKELKSGKLSKELVKPENPIELNPKDDESYFKLAQVYRVQDKIPEAEALFKKAIELNPKDDKSYVGLAQVYQVQNKIPEAEASFKKAIELNPKNDVSYVELGWIYRSQGKVSKAEASFKKAIELNPKNDVSYVALGRLYLSWDEFPEAEALFKKAIELNPKNDESYVGMGLLYLDWSKLPEAEASFKKVIELNPNNDKAYGALELLYAKMGNSRLTREYDKKAQKTVCFPSITLANYHKLEKILDKKGIVYVCVQYPTRNLEPLKKIFQSNTEGIIFVDNERIFKDALKQGSYGDYFKDTFGGGFGHCTPEGNKLLAENIANVILKEVFGK